MKEQYLKILGLAANPSVEDIKKAYRKKALESHPDRNKSKDSDLKFIEITEAYEYLTKYKNQLDQHNRKSDNKYKNVYKAPTDPDEYKEWIKVVKEKARRQSKMTYQEFKTQNEAFKKELSRKNRIFGWMVPLFFLIFIVSTILQPIIGGVIFTIALIVGVFAHVYMDIKHGIGDQHD